MTLNDRIKTLPPEQHQLFLELSTADLDVVSPASFLTAMGEVNEALRDRGYETLAAQQLSYFVQSQIETAQILIDLTNRQTAEALQQRVAFFAEPRTQQKPIDVNIHQTLQWFLEIPEDHPDVIVIHGQKFLILEGIESEPGNSRNYFCLLSVENSLFKKTTIINRHSRAHSKLFEEVQRYAREKYASFESDKPFKESKYQDKVVRAFDSFQEVNATNIFVPSGQVDLSGSRLVLTDDEGTVFSHVLNYENIGYGTPNYLQTDYGIEYRANSAREWFNSQKTNIKNIITVKGKKYVVLVQPDESGQSIQGIAFVSADPKDSKSVFIGYILANEIGEVLPHRASDIDWLVQALEKKLIKNKHASKDLRTLILETQKSKYQIHLSGISKTQLGFRQQESVVFDGATFVFFSSPTADDSDSGLHSLEVGTFDPFQRWYNIKERLAKRIGNIGYDLATGFINTADSAIFMSKLGGRTIAYMPNPHHPKDEAIVVIQDHALPKGSVYTLYFTSMNQTDRSVLNDLYNHFNHEKKDPLVETKDWHLARRFKTAHIIEEGQLNSHRHRLSQDTTLSFHISGSLVRVNRSQLTGNTEVSWFRPFTKKDVHKQIPNRLVRANDLRSSAQAYRLMHPDSPTPIEWFRSFSENDPNVIILEKDGEKIKFLVMGGAREDKNTGEMDSPTLPALFIEQGDEIILLNLTGSLRGGLKAEKAQALGADIYKHLFGQKKELLADSTVKMMLEAASSKTVIGTPQKFSEEAYAISGMGRHGQEMSFLGDHFKSVGKFENGDVILVYMYPALEYFRKCPKQAAYYLGFKPQASEESQADPVKTDQQTTPESSQEVTGILTLTGRARAFFIRQNSKSPEKATLREIERFISHDVMTLLFHEGAQDMVEDRKLAYEIYAQWQAYKAKEKMLSKDAGMPDASEFMTINDAKMWFAHLPLDHPEVIDLNGQKYLVVRPVSLLTVKDGIFQFLALGGDDKEALRSMVFANIKLRLQVAAKGYAVDPKVPKDLTREFTKHFGRKPKHVAVAPHRIVFSGYTLGVEDHVSQAGYSVPILGADLVQDIASELWHGETVLEWFDRLDVSDPSVLVIDGKKLYFSLSTHPETGKMAVLSMLSKDTHDGEPRIRIGRLLKDIHGNQFKQLGFTFTDFVLSLKEAAFDNKPIEPAVVRNVLERSVNTVSGYYFEDDIHTEHGEHGALTSFYSGGKFREITMMYDKAELGLQLLRPLADFDPREDSKASVSFNDWFHGLSLSATCVTVIDNMKVAYIPNRVSPEASAIIVYGQLFSPDKTVHVKLLDSALPAEANLLKKLHQAFSTGNTEDLTENVWQHSPYLFEVNRGSRQAHSVSEHIHSVIDLGHEETIVMAQRSRLTGQTSITEYRPFPALAISNPRPPQLVPLHDKQTLQIAEKLKTPFPRTPLQWFRDQKEGDPGVLFLTTHKSKRKVVFLKNKVLGGNINLHQKMGVLSLCYEENGKLNFIDFDTLKSCAALQGLNEETLQLYVEQMLTTPDFQNSSLEHVTLVAIFKKARLQKSRLPVMTKESFAKVRGSKGYTDVIFDQESFIVSYNTQTFQGSIQLIPYDVQDVTAIIAQPALVQETSRGSAQSQIATFRMKRLSISGRADLGFKNYDVYQDPQTGYGIAVYLKPNEENTANNVAVVFLFNAKDKKIQNQEDLVKVVTFVKYVHSVADYIPGEINLRLHDQEREDLVVDFRTQGMPEGFVELKLNKGALEGYFTHDKGAEMLMTVTVGVDEYDKTETLVGSPDEVKLEGRSVVIKNDISNLYQENVVSLVVSYDLDEFGKLDLNSVYVSVEMKTKDGDLKDSLPVAVPYHVLGGEQEQDQFVLGVFLPQTGIRLFIGSNDDIFNNRLAYRVVTNPDDVAVWEARQVQLKAMQHDLEPIRKLNEQAPLIDQIPISLSNGQKTDGYVRVASSPVPLVVKFNKSQFRLLKRERALMGHVIDIKLFHNVDFALRVVDVQDDQKGRRLTLHPVDSAVGKFEIHIVLSSQGSYFEFPEKDSFTVWLNRHAYGPRLFITVDEEKLSYEFSVLHDHDSVLSAQVKAITEAAVDFEGTAFEAMARIYEESMNKYQRVALDPHRAVYEPYQKEAEIIIDDVRTTLETDFSADDDILEQRLMSIQMETPTTQVCFTVDGEAVSFPFVYEKVPLTVHVSYETPEQDGLSEFDLVINGLETAEIQNESFQEFIEIVTTHERQDPIFADLKLSFDAITHPRRSAKMVATLHVSENLQEIFSLPAKLKRSLTYGAEEQKLVFRLPQIGHIVYQVLQTSEGVPTLTRETPLILWDVDVKGDVPYLMGVGMGEGSLDIRIPLTRMGVDESAPLGIAEEVLDKFHLLMSLFGFAVPMIEKEGEFLSITIDEEGELTLSIVATTQGLVTQSEFPVPSTDQAALIEALKPAELRTAEAPDQVRAPIIIDSDRDIYLQFEPHEKFLTSDNTITFLQESFSVRFGPSGERTYQTTLMQGNVYWYELVAEDSHLVLKLPFIWDPDDSRGPMVLDENQPILVYREGDDPAQAIPIDSERVRTQQNTNGSWSLRFIDSTDGGVAFEVMTVQTSWFRGAVNIVNEEGERATGSELSSLKKQARRNNNGHVAKITKRDPESLPPLKGARQQVIVNPTNRHVVFKYYQRSGNDFYWIELKGAKIKSGTTHYQIDDVITLNVGRGAGAKKEELETLTLIPVATVDEGTHVHYFVEKVSGEETGRCFRWDLRQGLFAEIEKNEALDDEDLGPSLSALPDMNVFATERRFSKNNSHVSMPEEVRRLPPKYREYGYPGDLNVRAATLNDRETVRAAFDRVHNSILIPDKESLFAQVLTGGDHVVQRFVSRDLIVEFSMHRNDSGRYEVDQEGVVMLLVREQPGDDNFIRVPCGLNRDRRTGRAKIEVATVFAGEEMGLNFEQVMTRQTLNQEKPVFVLTASYPQHVGKETLITPKEAGAVAREWVEFNSLDPNAAFHMSALDEDIALPDGRTLDLRIVEDNDVEGNYRLEGIRQEVQDGQALYEYACALDADCEVSQVKITRALNGGPLFYIHYDEDKRPLALVVSEHGEPCLFQTKTSTLNFIDPPASVQVPMLNQDLQPYKSEATSPFRAVLEDDSETQSTVAVSFYSGRWTTVSARAFAAEDMPCEKMEFQLHYDKEKRTFSVNEQARMRTQASGIKSILEWQEAQAELIHDHQGRQRVYMKGNRKGYAWVELENAESLISKEKQKTNPFASGRALYGYQRRAKPFLMPSDPGFLAIMYGMYMVDEDFVELLLGDLDNNPEIREDLINSQMRYDPGFALFMGALETFGITPEKEDDFGVVFASLIAAVEELKEQRALGIAGAVSSGLPPVASTSRVPSATPQVAPTTQSMPTREARPIIRQRSRVPITQPSRWRPLVKKPVSDFRPSQRSVRQGPPSIANGQRSMQPTALGMPTIKMMPMQSLMMLKPF